MAAVSAFERPVTSPTKQEHDSFLTLFKRVAGEQNLSAGGGLVKGRRRRYSLPANPTVTEYPFSPTRAPPADWSPTRVCSDALNLMNSEATVERSVEQGSPRSPISRLAKETIVKTLPCQATMHHVEVDPRLTKGKTYEEATLTNVTRVKRRTSRALSAEEIKDNCEKAISFFRTAREANETVRSQSKRGEGWSKLRKKFLRL